MNSGRSLWLEWSQALRVQRATLGSASRKVRVRQVRAGREGRQVRGGKGARPQATGKGATSPGESQGQAATSLTSRPSVVPLGRAGKAPTQGPHRQRHCCTRSWEWLCPSPLLH